MHPNLIKLLISNRGKGFFKVENKKETDEATIYMYGAIVNDDWEAEYFGGISPQMFIRELQLNNASTIHLRINSIGGSYFAATTMRQAMKDHKAQFVCHIDGVCASAATYFPISAQASYMTPGGMLMIHETSAMASGTAKEIQRQVEWMQRLDNSIAEEYAKKTGKDVDQIRQWMDAETYFIGQEAVDAGFIDKMAEGVVKNQIEWDLSTYDPAKIQNWKESYYPHPTEKDNKPDPQNSAQEEPPPAIKPPPFRQYLTI